MDTYKKIAYSFLMLCPLFSNAVPYIIPPRPMPPHPEEIGAVRKSSFPYIAGDTFRAECDFCIDEERIPFDPEKVQDGDTIFVCGWDLEFFFSVVHPEIKRHYILITHHSDMPAPGKYEAYLEDEKLIAWFGQNCNITHHPKFFRIPIGLANSYWPHGNTVVLSQEISQGTSGTRDILAYMNFNPGTHKDERVPVWHLFKDKPYCYTAGRTNYRTYLKDLKRSLFVISPRGNGLDCHRHWESMLMGAIPIIKHSTLDPLFENLPVLLIDDWNEITPEFLLQAYNKLRSQTFCLEKLFAPYWLTKIAEVKKGAKQYYGANTLSPEQ